MIGAAIRVARIATGEEDETPETDPKKSAAGKRGGQNRAKTLTADDRKRIAAQGSEKRWSEDSHKD